MELQKHYDSIDGLRALSAIGIVLMHIAANNTYIISGKIYKIIIPFFTNFVFLFMIISGFSMCCGYYKKIVNRTISISRFYEKRYEKIWPFFALLVLIDLVMNPSLTSVIEGFADLTLAFALLPNPNINVIGVGWTLGVIFLFYMLFPFFCFILEDRRRAWITFLITILYNIVCDIYFMDTAHVIEDFSLRTNFLFCAMYFVMGGIVYLYRELLVRFVKRFRIFSLVLCVLITILYCIVDSRVSSNESIVAIGMMVMFSFWLIYAIGSNGIILNNPFVKFISSISMEIYLCHMMIFRILEKLHMNYLFGTGVLSYITASLLVLVGAIIFSISVKHFLYRIRNFMDRKWIRF